MVDITFTTKEYGIMQMQTVHDEKDVWVEIYPTEGLVVSFVVNRGRERIWDVCPRTGFWNKDYKGAY